jgi:uncharacterized membrane protein YdbT with pleckstrin-like domain
MTNIPSDDQSPDPNESPSSGPPTPDETNPAPQAPASPSTPKDRFNQAAQARQGEDEDEQEEDLWEGRFSSRAMLGSWLLAGSVTVVLLAGILAYDWRNGNLWLGWIVICALLWGWFAIQLLYRKLTYKYHLTSQRFIHESGLLKRMTDRIEVIDIDDVSFEQRIVERFLGVGSIKITSSDRSHPELWLRGIENVKDVAGLIDDTRRRERRRRGLHIEAI